MTKLAAALALSFTMTGAAHAASTLIDFEGLANGTVITNQFAGVTFGSTAGQEVQVSTQPGIGFGSNFICTAVVNGAINCSQEVFLNFSSAVENLSFWQVGDNASGVVGQVDVFVGGALDSTLDILGFNTFNTPDLVDLTMFTDVTGIRIHNVTDPGGLGYDNFSFDTSAVIPLPAGLPLLLTGLAGVGLLARRKPRA